MELRYEKIIDLSYTVDEKSPCELPIEPANIYDTATIEEEGYFEGRVDMSGHYSTHIDTPSLMYAEGYKVNEIPTQKFHGFVTLVNLSEIKEPGDEVSLDEIKAWEDKNGDIPEGNIVFMRTGMGDLAYQEIFNQKWIGLSGDAAEYLCQKKIKIIGTDASSIDSLAGHEIDCPAHHTFLKNGIPIIENIKDLDQMPKQFYVIIAPLKLAKSSGAPTRVFAFV